MTIFGIIKRLREETGLSVDLDNGAISVQSPDYDLTPGFEFTANGIVVQCRMGQHVDAALLTWEEVNFIQQKFNP